MKFLAILFSNSKGLLTISIVFFIVRQALTQSYYSGSIVDSKQNAIPYVHIQVVGTEIGTVTNSNGVFTLYIPAEVKSSKVKISCIGYTSRQLFLARGNNNIILEEELTQLELVIVTPRDYARELVEKAIENIPSNYPDHEERHTGFFREMTFWGDGDPFDPIYISEAVLESIKGSYKKRQTTGAVKLIEGRTYKSEGLDSLTISFYSGPYEPFRNDMVAQREAPLDRPEAYDYEIIDTTRLSDTDVFKISFNKNDSRLGYIFIMDSTYAIVKAEFHLTKFPQLNLTDRGRKSQDYVIEYFQGEAGKWHLKRTNYKTGIIVNKRLFTMTREYATTNVIPNEEDISYEERVEFSDIFHLTTGDYNAEFWKNYNTIIPDGQLESYFKRKPIIQKLSKRQKTRMILSKFELNYELSYSQIRIYDCDFSYSNSVVSLDEIVSGESVPSIGITTALYFNLNSNYLIGLRSSSAFTRNKAESFDLEFSKRFNINRGGRPLLLSSGIQFGHQKLQYFIEDYKSASEFMVSGKQFDSGKTALYLESRNLRIQPVISLSIKGNRRIQFLASVGYNLVLSSKSGLFLMEKDQFFITRKNAFLRNGKDGLAINPGEIMENRLSMSIGINLKL